MPKPGYDVSPEPPLAGPALTLNVNTGTECLCARILQIYAKSFLMLQKITKFFLNFPIFLD